MIQTHRPAPVAPAGAVGIETTGSEPEPAGLVELGLPPLTVGSPSGTGVPPRASGYDEGLEAPEADLPAGAFCAPRTEEADPGGSVHLAAEFTGGRCVVWSGPVRWVPP